jgi:arylsulfatase A-like enzyme/Tfp pilus assembly protein PilF
VKKPLLWTALGALLLGLSPTPGSRALQSATPAASHSLLLLTLDTTRADHIGCYGYAGARTQTLDHLAAGGVRYARALAPTPLTLPSHATLLTGLLPPEHGLRDNGTAVLPGEIPTLATALAGRGHATAAFVASRVLDARFGLGRGFTVYDDRMAAERVGEYGYPERPAAQVTAAAIAWLRDLPAGRPFFLWVHYYDPHAPYEPLPEYAHLPPYDAEIAAVDREIGRLLAALPGGPGAALVAAVGDHGESLGEHGERGHGLFLYRGPLEVPLLIAGPGVARGETVSRLVATQDLPGHLLHLVGVETGKFPPALRRRLGEREAVYSETWFPLTAYGWSPLRALTRDRYRFIAAPRPELYDFVADPAESRNLASDPPAAAAGLRRELATLERDLENARPAAAPLDAELAAALQSLGYATGSGARSSSGLDPKDGPPLLERFEQAKRLLRAGAAAAAAAELEALVRASPGNVPFLNQLATAQLAAGEGAKALATHRAAIALNPRLEFLHRLLADALLRLGKLDESEKEYRVALKLNPRFAPAWLGLSEAAKGKGGPTSARAVLEEAARAGVESATVWLELGKLELQAGDTAAARQHLDEAQRTAPGSPAAREAQRLRASIQD